MKPFFFASPTQEAQKALAELTRRYGQTKSPKSCDVIVALGGDGTTLRALQKAIAYNKPVFGINFGHAGHMQNFNNIEGDLIARIEKAEPVELTPIKAKVMTSDGTAREAFAINEVNICNRKRTEAISLKITVGDSNIPINLIGDGVIISTPLGSTGYNRSAGGPVLPLNDNLLAVTPNNPYSSGGFRATAFSPCEIIIDVISPTLRTASAFADNKFVERNKKVEKVIISLATENKFSLLFDPGYGPHERIIRTHSAPPSPEI